MATAAPTLEELRPLLRHLVPGLRRQYKLASLGIFGSYVRNEQRADSDLDLLVTFDEPPSLLKLIELENHLSDALGVKVDLVLKDSLKPHIGKQVLAEVLPL
jgi:hypothetical protein